MTSRPGRPRYTTVSSLPNPWRVKRKASGPRAGGGAAFPVVAVAALLLLAASAACAPRTPRSRLDGAPVPSDPPPAGKLEEPAEPDRHAALLHPTRLVFRSAGYSLRPPLGWVEPDQRPSLALDLFLADPATGATLAVSRGPSPGRRYDAWLAAQRGLLDGLRVQLREVKVLDARVEARRGLFLFRIDHLHQAGGAYYHARKAFIFAGDSIVTLDFNAPTDAADRLAPLFEALLDAFELLDPARGVLEQPEQDYIAEFRPEEGKGRIVMPVPRHFVRDDVATARSALARWSLARTVTLTLAEHLHPSIGLEPYGEFQVGVLRGAGHHPTESGPLEGGAAGQVFRIAFETKAGLKSLFFIFDAGDRYYQLILTTDPVSYPFFVGWAERLAGDVRVGGS